MSCTCSHLQVVGGSLLPEAVTWFFTSVLRGLQFHGQHETCNATLSYLAMLIYDNLVSLVPIITQLDYSLNLYPCHYFCRDYQLVFKMLLGQIYICVALKRKSIGYLYTCFHL